MKPLTALEAYDLINSTLTTAWNSNINLVSPVPTNLYYPGVVMPTTLQGNQYHGKITIKTTITTQSSFASSDASGPGKRIFDTHGFLVLQLFCPLSQSGSFYKGKQLSEAIKNALGTSASNADVWFQDTTVLELTPEELFFRFNVKSRFEYSELR